MQKLERLYSEGFENLANDAYDRYKGNIGIKLEDKKQVDKTDSSGCDGVVMEEMFNFTFFFL